MNEIKIRAKAGAIKGTMTFTKEETSIRDTPLANLCNAIIEQAVSDYRNDYRGTRKSCDKFFRSEFFSLLTNVDGNWLADELARECKESDRKKRARLFDIVKEARCSGF